MLNAHFKPNIPSAPGEKSFYCFFLLILEMVVLLIFFTRLIYIILKPFYLVMLQVKFKINSSAVSENGSVV